MLSKEEKEFMEDFPDCTLKNSGKSFVHHFDIAIVECELYFIVKKNKNIIGYAMSKRYCHDNGKYHWSIKKYKQVTLNKWNSLRHKWSGKV